MSSSLGGGGGGRDYGHIRFALSTITGIFAASSGKGEIYTAGRRRGRAAGSAFLSRGRMSPRRRKESWTSCVYRVGWEGMEMAGERPARRGCGGSMLAPTLSPSLAHPSIISDPHELCPTCPHPLLVKRKRSRAKQCVVPRHCQCRGQELSWRGVRVCAHQSPPAPPLPILGDLLNQDRNSSPRPDTGPAGFCPSLLPLIKQVLGKWSLVSAIGFERLPPHF